MRRWLLLAARHARQRRAALRRCGGGEQRAAGPAAVSNSMSYDFDPAGRLAAARARGHSLHHPGLRPKDAAADRERRRPALRRQADRSAAPTGRNRRRGTASTTGPRSATYQAKFNFVVAGHVGGGDSVPPRLASSARADRLDAGRARRARHEPFDTVPTPMRHFYRTHLSPADVLAVGR